MKLIVMWLWGAALVSLWWVAIATGIAPLIMLSLAATILTAGAFGFYLYENWDKEEQKGV